ncbi:thioredoxin family protein [Marinomonas spartinae]|uniref:thioredoxin family protein n=1 Tax=Marinomonas spartinae TaxID=1792290 RepID=UPI0018F1A8F4|nr:thioredoxin domain-containing protein [Marinomonas spartinae]MBJ7556576.1 hypothetical protein [Marinomonas spartinae]
MSNLIINLTDVTVDDVLNNTTTPILLDLWAPWCGPCLTIAPLLEKIAQNTVGQLTVAKLDTEKYESLIPRFRVRSIPTLILFYRGKEVSRKIGVDSPSDLNNWLRAQDIDVEDSEEIVIKEAYKWPSFYQDEALFVFLTQRIQKKALAGEISCYNFPRPENLLTTPYALAGQESYDVFERVTGLPPSLAVWLEVMDYTTPKQINELTNALTIGKDYSHVALQMIFNWLASNETPWQTLLPDTLLDARQHWLSLVTDYLAGKSTPRKSWLAIQTQANEFLAQAEQSHQFSFHYSTILALLSPLPGTSIEDNQAIEAIIYNLAECQIYSEKLKSGWSLEELDMANDRWNWIEPQIPIDISEEDYELLFKELCLRWSQKAPEFTAFAEKEATFNKHVSSIQNKLNQGMQKRFIQLLKEAPDTHEQYRFIG